MKTILKVIGGLLIGVAIGFAIAAAGIVCFTDTTFSEFTAKFFSLELKEVILSVGIAIGAFAVSLFLLVLIHETGHLLFGLLSGYRFVSFRIFNVTFIKEDGKVKMKRFSIAGTGGQCLLTPPEMSYDKIPVFWYNAGGVIANILAGLLVLPLLWIKGYPLLSEAVVIFIITGIFLIIVNGVPMKISGIGNDAYNILKLRKEPESVRGLAVSLKSNAMIQRSVRPKDMPEEWFRHPDEINYGNQFEVALALMSASRLIDEMQFDGALEKFKEFHDHREQMIGIYAKEVACELLFLYLVAGDRESAEDLLDEDLKKYISSYRKVMSSKERILFAEALLLDNNHRKALDIYNNLKKREGEYLLQGEVKSDLAIMEHLLKGY